jgi:hypothetical protein
MARNSAVKERERITFYICATFLGLALSVGILLLVLG